MVEQKKVKTARVAKKPVPKRKIKRVVSTATSTNAGSKARPRFSSDEFLPTNPAPDYDRERANHYRLRRWKRIMEITRVLAEHGFFNIARKVSAEFMRAGRSFGAATMQLRIPVTEDEPKRVREMLEVLGPTYIKMGQMFATRPDLIQREFIEEFEKLYDQTSPEPYSKVRRTIERELGMRMDRIFDSFEKLPIASASMAQVHRARLKSGDEVAVKVLRSGMEKNIDIDIEIVSRITKFIARMFRETAPYNPQGIAREMELMIKKEINFTNEAHNMEIIADNFRSDPRVKIPKVYKEFSSRRVLTMEYIDGIRFGEEELPQLEGMDREKIVRNITQSMLTQVLQHRFFHADPSPGNILVIDEDTIAYLDFGAVGHITQRRRDAMIKLIEGFLSNDVDRVVDAYLVFGEWTGDLDIKGFKKEVGKVLDFFHTEEPSIADPALLDMLIQAAQQFDVRLPADFFLIERALFQTDGIARKLDPDYDMIEAAEPVIRQIAFERYGPKAMIKYATKTARDYTKLFRKFPSRADKILKKAELGEFDIRIEHKGAKDLLQRIDDFWKRSGITLFGIAELIGLAIVMTTNNRTLIIYYMLASFMIFLFWLVIMILISEYSHD